MAEMNLMGVEEHVAENLQMWKAVITSPNPFLDGKIWKLNKNDDDDDDDNDDEQRLHI